jgi:hypothetical protein
VKSRFVSKPEQQNSEIGESAFEAWAFFWEDEGSFVVLVQLEFQKSRETTDSAWAEFFL